MLDNGTPVVMDLNYPLATVTLRFVRFTHTMVLATSTRLTLVFQTRAMVLDRVVTATLMLAPFTRIVVSAMRTKRTSEVLDHAMTEFYHTMVTVTLLPAKTMPTTGLAISTECISAVLVNAVGSDQTITAITLFDTLGTLSLMISAKRCMIVY